MSSDSGGAQITQEEVEASLNEINELVKTPQFQELLAEMRALPTEELRYRFVRDVVMNKGTLTERGITVPDTMIVQRSVFMDGRPTLFCVTKYLSDRQQKVTVTFDDAQSD
jgi:hypothetical protein